MHSLSTHCFAFILTFYLARCQFETGMSGNRRVVVQLFEWPYTDVKEECKNVLGHQQFGAVLVSPVTENVKIRHEANGEIMRPWYERYQPVSWKMVTRSGNERDFQEMVEECNKNDVRVYVDTVLNHGAWSKAGQPSGDLVGVAGTPVNVNKKSYPGLGFDSTNFHDACDLDGTNSTSMRICELWGLQDINQTQPYVQSKIVAFLNKLISFGVAGFRIDAAKHMWPEDLIQIYNQLNNVSLQDGRIIMRPFWALEIVDDGTFQDDYKDIGSEYDFSLCGMITDAFRWGSVRLASIYEYAQKPTYRSKTLQALSANQDTQREVWQDGYWNSRDRSGLQKVINAFILSFTRDTPNIFSGFSFKHKDEGPPSDESDKIISPSQCNNGWTCEHRDQPLQWIIKYFTNVVKDAPIEEWWSEWSEGANQAAFQRGRTGFAVFNADSKELKKTFQVSLPAGIYCDLATGYYCHHHKMCMGWLKRKVEIKENGTLEISLPGLSRSEEAHEPAHLLISVESKYPPASETEEEPNPSNPLLDITDWIMITVIVVVAVIGVVLWFLFKQSNNNKSCEVRE